MSPDQAQIPRAQVLCEWVPSHPRLQGHGTRSLSLVVCVAAVVEDGQGHLVCQSVLFFHAPLNPSPCQVSLPPGRELETMWTRRRKGGDWAWKASRYGGESK
jgi:hypothetical protein